MNFEDIKIAMDAQAIHAKVPRSMKEIKGSRIPVQQLRKRMIFEVACLLFFIVLFFAIGPILDLDTFPRGVYYHAIFLSSLTMIVTIIRLSGYLKKTHTMDINSKEALIRFIHESELTVEMYRTASLVGSLFLIVAAAAIKMGQPPESLSFYNCFALNLPLSKIALLFLVMLLIFMATYIIVQLWTNQMYVKYIKKLKAILHSFEEE